MGQYFIPVNVTKREYVCNFCLRGVSKLWEWCANKEAGLLAYLLRKSDKSGGGDIPDPEEAIYAGRWAGDEVYLVGDYDSSRLFQQAKREFHNITEDLVREYNQFMQHPDFAIKVKRCEDHDEIN